MQAALSQSMRSTRGPITAAPSIAAVAPVMGPVPLRHGGGRTVTSRRPLTSMGRKLKRQCARKHASPEAPSAEPDLSTIVERSALMGET